MLYIECVSYCFSECFNIIELIELDHKTFSKLFIDERLLKALFDNMINELRLDDDFFDNMYKGSLSKVNIIIKINIVIYII